MVVAEGEVLDVVRPHRCWPHLLQAVAAHGRSGAVALTRAIDRLVGPLVD